jgi:hypothetical protein
VGCDHLCHVDGFGSDVEVFLEEMLEFVNEYLGVWVGEWEVVFGVEEVFREAEGWTAVDDFGILVPDEKE